MPMEAAATSSSRTASQARPSRESLRRNIAITDSTMMARSV